MKRDCSICNIFVGLIPKTLTMKKIQLALILLTLIKTSFAQIIDPAFAPKVLRAGSGNALAAQSDGKMLISSQSQGFVDDQPVNFMFRLDENGAHDPSFQYPSHLSNAPAAVQVQQDGKILIGGNFKDTTGQYLGSLLRLLPNGTIDPSFTILQDEFLSLVQIEILPNQKIFVRGGTVGISKIQLLGKDGTVLTHYKAIGVSGVVAAIGVQSNNELIVAGTSMQIGDRTQNVFRMDSTGQLDPNFSPQPVSVSNFIVQNMAILPSGTLGFLAADGTNVSIFDRNGQSVASFSLFNERAFLHRASSTSFIVLGQQGYEVFENGQYRNLQVVNANNYAFWATEQPGNRLVLTGPLPPLVVSFGQVWFV